MSANTRTTLLSLAIIMVLLFSAVRPKPAYADDGTPPEATATQVTEGTQTEAGTQRASKEKTKHHHKEKNKQKSDSAAPLAGEAAGPVQTEAATPAPAQDPAPTEAAAPVADANILGTVPENTQVTVLDGNGEAQPLATQAAADAIATSDPIWCPGTQAPTPRENGCTDSFTSFDLLLTFLSGNTTYSGPGTIYVQQGAYTGNDPNNVIDFNSPDYDLSNIRNSSLNITGGWNTTTNTIEPTVQSTFNGYSIIIGSSANPWGGSLTISNIIVTGSDTNGIELYSNADVNVDNSRFDRNQQTGALIRAGGNVNVRNSVFGQGDTFTVRRQVDGLDIVSGADTSLFGVIANDNYEFGTNIQSTGLVTIANSVFNGQMDQGTSDTGEAMFRGYGLNVVTPNSIDIFNVTANNNYLWGAMLDAGGDITIADSTFNANSTNQPGFIDDTGLFITGGQDVALNNVTAIENRLYGAQINVDGIVSVNNSNFNKNVGVTTINGVTNYYGTGLQVTTLSDIFINNTNATGNSLFGGQLNAGGQVAVSGGSFSNTSTTVATALLGTGLEIVSGANTSLSNVVLDANQTVGADIQAQGDAYLDTITVTNNGTDGVVVQAVCVHLNGGQYSGNGQYGLNLGTSALDILSPAIFSGNVGGNIFPATPVSCAPATTGGGTTGGDGTTTGGDTTPTGGDTTPTGGNTTPTGGSNTPTGSNSAGTTKAAGTGSSGTPLLSDTAAASVSSPTVSLNLFTGSTVFKAAASSSSAKNVSLAKFLALSDTGIGLFTGSYAYLDTDNGLVVIVLVPAAEEGLAMSMP